MVFASILERMDRPIRILIAKVGLDGHDRGARVVASALRDAGMEVIYTGLRKTPEVVVEAALQEDVDAVGVSILSGAHMTVFPTLRGLMNVEGMDDVILLGGGTIPDDDAQALLDAGDVSKVFTPGASLDGIVAYLREAVAEKRGA